MIDTPDTKTPRPTRATGRFARTDQPLLASLRPAPGAIDEAPTGRRAVERRDRRYRRLLAGADGVAAVAALLVAVELLGTSRIRPEGVVLVAMVLSVAKLQGLYDRDELLVRKTTLEEAPKLFGLSTVCTLLFVMAQPALLDGHLDTGQVVALWAALLGGSLVGRRVARSVARRTVPTERILMVSDGDAFARMRAKLTRDDVNAELVGRMALSRIGSARPRPRHGGTELSELIAELDAHRVILEPASLTADEMLDFVRAAKAVGVRVSLLPQVLDVVGGSVVFDDVHGMTVMGVRRFGLTHSSLLLKRAFDVACASLLLLVLAPLLALIALAVRLDSPGPILFRQTRVGRRDRHFRIAKFRTMCIDAEERKEALRHRNEADGLFKIAADPRVTRVGRLLRRTSLDELPQLFNVLAGDMSLVGPRPLVVDEDEQITGWDRRRLHLTPGMTGHWQILGSARVPLQEMVKIDYLYVSTWTLWTDLKILLRTVPHVLSRRGM